MTDVVIDRLRLRGPGARRLAGVAARSLPHALERALDGAGDADLPTIHVTLVLDPVDHDDEALAALWAEAIAAEVSRSATTSPRRTPPSLGGAAPREALGGDGTPGRDGPTRSAGDPASVARAVLDWLAGPEDAPVPAAVAHLVDPDVAAAVVAALGRSASARLGAVLGRLAAGVGSPAVTGDRARGSAAGDRGTARLPSPQHPHVAQPQPRTETGGAGDDAGTEGRVVAEVRGAAGVLAPVATLAASSGARGWDPRLATRSAGLVLLYPWLADLCRDAVALHPGLDPGLVRAAALGILAGAGPAGPGPAGPGPAGPGPAGPGPAGAGDARPAPARPAPARPAPAGAGDARPAPARPAAPLPRAAVDDALVRLLAGLDAVAEDGSDAPLAALPHGDEVAAAADAVLGSFASLLPGFATSSPTFVRGQWIARAGLLDLEASPARLAAAARPLDVVLPRLPYPVSLIKLPWSPLLTVRFVP